MKMLRSGHFATAFSLVVWAAPPGWAAPEVGLLPSVATTEDGAATILNPAGLGWTSGIGLHVTTAGYRSLPSQAYNLGLGLGGAGLALRHEATAAGDRQEVGFASSVPIGPGLRGGFSYRIGRENDRAGADWDLGLLFRPTNWVSVGGVARDVGGSLPGDPRNYQLGIAFRPVGDRFTLSLDESWSEGRRWIEAVQSLGLEFEPLDGLTFRAEANLDAKGLDLARPFANTSLRFGLAIASPRLDVGGMTGSLNPQGQGSSPIGGAATYFRARENRGRALWYGAPEVLELKLRGNLGPDRSALGVITGSANIPPVASTLEVLDRAARDPQLRALALTIDQVRVSLADVQEIRAAILHVRKAGKTVVAYLPGGGYSELLLASAADRLLLNPTGSLEFTGFGREQTYIKGLMDKVGIKAEFISTGPYKTAMEPYSRESMSEAQRKQLEELTGDQFDQVVASIADGRKITVEEMKAQIDRGILSAPEAQQVGIVDELASQDALEEVVAKYAGTNNVVDAFERPVRVRSWSPPRIAVVYATGAITSGASGNDFLMGRTLGEDTFVKALRDIREDNRIRAVVIRIDSPGGGAPPSESIRREVERVRNEKPVIVSMAGIAASGGYWIACGTDRILADPATLTGSIGVFVGKFSADDLLGKAGVKSERVTRGRFAGLDSPYRPFRPEEQALLQSSADFTYGRFLELVSNARKMSQSKVKELAGGRVYTGRRALEVGLVDREAGLLEAIAEAKAASGLTGTDEVELWYFPDQLSFLLSEEPLVLFDIGAQIRKGLASAEQWSRHSVWLLNPDLLLGGSQ